MNTKIFVMLIWSLYLDQQAIQQARWFIRQGTWRDMNRKKNQELLSNFRWLNATKEQSSILIHGKKKHAKDYRPNSKFPWCGIRVSEESSPGHHCMRIPLIL